MVVWTMDMAFGGRSALVQTPSYNCGISTAKDGVFKARVTMIIADAVYLGPQVEKMTGRPIGKFIYSEHLRPSDYLVMHDTIVGLLDAAGQTPTTLGRVITFIGETLKKQGTVTECMNLLVVEESDLGAKIDELISTNTRKQNATFSCPDCSQQVRVPAESGRIRITCPKCSCQFMRET